jgi:hypothetical protein
MKSAHALTYIRRLWTALISGQPSAKRQLLYTESGHDGYVIYKDAEGEIPMYFEFGGGDCVVIIQVPSVDERTKKIKRLSAERDAILHFIAQQVVRDKAPTCNYRISGNNIEIFKR